MSDEEVISSPRPGTTAALEARVARLERQYDTLSTTVSGVAVDAAVTRTRLESMGPDIRDLNLKIDGMLAVMQKSMGDPAETPAGRLINERMAEFEQERDEEHAALRRDVDLARADTQKIRLWIAAVAGGLAVLTTIVNFVAPVVLKALHLT